MSSITGQDCELIFGVDSFMPLLSFLIPLSDSLCMFANVTTVTGKVYFMNSEFVRLHVTVRTPEVSISESVSGFFFSSTIFT